jgi:hypothetical protein
MGLSSGKKTTTKTTPWGPAQPYIEGSLSGLQAANQNATQAIQQFTPSLDAAIAKATSNINSPPQYLTDAGRSSIRRSTAITSIPTPI